LLLITRFFLQRSWGPQKRVSPVPPPYPPAPPPPHLESRLTLSPGISHWNLPNYLYFFNFISLGYRNLGYLESPDVLSKVWILLANCTVEISTQSEHYIIIHDTLGLRK